jgi:hypothetical protein
MIQSAETLDALLATVIKEHQDKVVDWINDVPGSWGFLAGRAVLACKEYKGGPLTNSERRVVWHRMWELLSVLKEQIAK